jgi:hypothetical protein
VIRGWHEVLGTRHAVLDHSLVFVDGGDLGNRGFPRFRGSWGRALLPWFVLPCSSWAVSEFTGSRLSDPFGDNSAAAS